MHGPVSALVLLRRRSLGRGNLVGRDEISVLVIDNNDGGDRVTVGHSRIAGATGGSRHHAHRLVFSSLTAINCCSEAVPMGRTASTPGVAVMTVITSSFNELI